VEKEAKEEPTPGKEDMDTSMRSYSLHHAEIKTKTESNHHHVDKIVEQHCIDAL
jgi:mannose-6-phosphate isomerase-like protein (cupin superfamily)